MAASEGASRQQLILGHPPGLFVLVGLKVWEVFSYIGMRAFLVLYIGATFGFADAKAALVFGSYGALVLATALFGGFIADRLIGARASVLLGAAVIMGGHIGLSLEALLGPGETKLQLFFLSLAAVAAGTGLLKPNVLAMVAQLYDDLDAQRREAGFYAYYVGVNIGGLLAPLVCGYLAFAYGWHWGFAAAAAGMSAGLILVVTQRDLLPAGARRPLNPLMVGNFAAWSASLLLVVLTLLGCWLLVQRGVALGVVLGVAIVGGLVYGAIVTRALDAVSKRALLQIIAVLPSVAMFVLLYEQIGTTITLFVDRFVNRDVGFATVATAQVVALNSAFVILFVPVLATVWRALAKYGRVFDAQAKFIVGFLLIAASFAVLAGAANSAELGPVTLYWIVGAYLLLTLGELSIAPVAYAEAGRLAPPGFAGTVMGLVLLSFAFGNLMSGALAGQADTQSGAGGSAGYADFFAMLSVVAIGYAALLAGILWLARKRSAT